MPEAWLDSLRWRQIGPAGMAGRVTSLAVNPQDPSNYFVGMATGGVVRTVNSGVTFQPVFDTYGSSSIGDIAVAAGDPKIVWAGTGESNPRNSVSYGDGVYKSSDGGTTWTHMGLKETFQIGAVLIHPKNPDVVYVGAMGRLWGRSQERGMYKTTDGGKTWTKVLFVNDRTGVIDAVMDPRNPDVVYAATWERMRGPYDSYPGSSPRLPDGIDGYDPIVRWEPGGGIWKTTNGGKSWARLTNGLPPTHLGRVGLDIYQQDPNVIYAVVDCRDIGRGPEPPRVTTGFTGEADSKGLRLTAVPESGPAKEAGLAVGDLLVEVDGKPFTTMIAYFDHLRSKERGQKLHVVRLKDGKRETLEITLASRPAPAPQVPTIRGTLGLELDDAESGLVVRTVRPGRLADGAGVQVDDVLIEFDGQAVKTVALLTEVLQKEREENKVELKLRRGDQVVTVSVTLPPRGQTANRRWYGGILGGQLPNMQDMQGEEGWKYGGVYRSGDGGRTWKRLNSLNPRPMYFSKIRVDPRDENTIYVLGVDLHWSRNGGRTFTADAGQRVHADHHALWINPTDTRHLIVGTDGGWYTSYDRTRAWRHHNNLPLGQFYHVAIDSRVPYWVYGGMQDNGSWGGPSMSRHGTGPVNEDWIRVGGGDGFTCRVDPNDPNIVYATSQNGAMVRNNFATGETVGIRPRPEPGRDFRFNWNTPFILSAHNPGVFYCAGNYVWRSLRRGDDLRRISGDLARTSHGSATALGESPLNPNVLWVGTDDGLLWVTRDGGQTWTNVTRNVGLKGSPLVGTVEPSRFAEGRCYVALTALRSDDDKPYLFMTDDFGQTWTNVTANLPEFGSTRCLREDPANPNLLFTGTEFGVFASIDRGKSWRRINNNLPTVRVDELAIHSAMGEIVAATHGRSLWILEITALRQMTVDSLTQPATLYEPRTAYFFRRDPGRGYGSGHEKFFGDNGPMGATMYYSLQAKVEGLTLEVFDAAGRSVRRFSDLPKEPGLHRALWEPIGRAAQPGLYKVVLTVDGKTQERSFRLEADPMLAGERVPIAGPASEDD